MTSRYDRGPGPEVGCSPTVTVSYWQGSPLHRPLPPYINASVLNVGARTGGPVSVFVGPVSRRMAFSVGLGSIRKEVTHKGQTSLVGRVRKRLMRLQSLRTFGRILGPPTRSGCVGRRKDIESGTLWLRKIGQMRFVLGRRGGGHRPSYVYIHINMLDIYI